MAALKQPTIRVVAIIAEGVPEADTKQLIAYARSNNKVTDWNLFSKFGLNLQCWYILEWQGSDEANKETVNYFWNILPPLAVILVEF